MKNLIKIMLMMFMLSVLQTTEAQGPPDPPGNPGLGGGPVGGSASAGEGTTIMLTAAMLWGLRKLRAHRKSADKDKAEKMP